MELLACHTSFKGEQRYYRHFAQTLQCSLQLAIYIPVASLLKNCPCHINYYLPGLQTDALLVASQSDYQRYANRYDTILVIPDLFKTYHGDDESRVGQYMQEHESIHNYLLHELPALMQEHFSTCSGRSIMGYGFGGTLAIYLALQHPEHYRSISALAPWIGFYGNTWYNEHLVQYDLPAHFDALQWYRDHPTTTPLPLWIDQGTEDDHLGSKIDLDAFENFIATQPISENIWINWRKRYDHSFYFVHSHIREHFVFHAEYYDS